MPTATRTFLLFAPPADTAAARQNADDKLSCGSACCIAGVFYSACAAADPLDSPFFILLQSKHTISASFHTVDRCCTQCGNVLDEAAFASDVTFTKGPGGESAVDGQRVSEGGVARGMGRIAGGRQYGHQVWGGTSPSQPLCSSALVWAHSSAVGRLNRQVRV